MPKTIAKPKNEDQLHLILKGEWYAKIKSGVKTEEYRSFNDYWIKRLCILKGEEIVGVKEFKTVKFHNGYTDEHMIFECKNIFIDTFKNSAPDGVELGSTLFTIELGVKLFQS